MNALALPKPSSLPLLAARLADLGYLPVPIPSGKKGPLQKDWQHLRLTAETAPAAFAGAGLVGILHTNTGVLDIDVTDPALSADFAAEVRRRWPDALERIGAAPKTAFWFKVDGEQWAVKNTRRAERTTAEGEVLTAQVEVRAFTGQAVAYGLHPVTLRPYSWPNGELWATARDALPMLTGDDAEDFRNWADARIAEWAGPQPVDLLRIDTGGERCRALSLETGRGEVEEILDWIDPDVPYKDWLAVLMALHGHFNGSAEGFALADAWSAKGAKYRAGDVASRWAGLRPTVGPKGALAAACALAAQAGADLKGIALRHRGRPPDDLAQDFPPPSTAPNAGPVRRAKWCADLACSTLETDPAWRSVLAFDELAQLTMLLQPIPGTKVPKASFKPRPICDTDFTEVVRWFNRNGYPDATRNTVTEAVYLVAGQTVISPVRHYLESLQWDGTPRAADWLTRYCGAAPSDLTGKVGKAWLISAVARALSPGCKADCALVLEGPQGAGKSSVLRALAGEAWFHDGLSDLHGKDASAALRGKWIIELPELAAMRRSDNEAVKAFLSRTEERYRPPYGRAEVVEPRRCVFAGTTNRADYLNDDTGGRRFWPITVGQINLPDLKRDRDQLWSEAVALYRAGAPWWLDAEAEIEAAAVVSTRAADDPWTADVLAAVAGMAECSTRDVFQLLDIDRERWGKPEGMRIAGILTRAGWTRAGKFSGGPNRNLACYVAPGGDHA